MLKRFFVVALTVVGPVAVAATVPSFEVSRTVAAEEVRSGATGSEAQDSGEHRTETVTVEVPDDSYLLSTKEPFVPRDTDYSVEFGSAAENRSLYWVGLNIGQHLGRCVLTSSETCQQYLDGIVGVSGRDEQTYGLFLGSVRWQFVNFPRSWSPMIRVFAGETYAHVREEKEWRFTYGAGLGVTTYLHERVDLRFEVRGGELGAHPFIQGVMGVQFKADRLLEYFAVELGKLGISTAETAIKVTGDALKGAAKSLGGGEEKKSVKPQK